MNPGGLSRRILLETLVRLIDDSLAAKQGPSQLSSRLVLFPKRVHELGSREGRAPDGLSPDYVRLAVELNEAALAAEPAPGTADRLLSSVEQVVGAATVYERALVALIQRL